LKKRKFEEIEEQTGGDPPSCQDNIIQCLKFDIPDSLHDFGKSRNKYFPEDTTS